MIYTIAYIFKKINIFFKIYAWQYTLKGVYYEISKIISTYKWKEDAYMDIRRYYIVQADLGQVVGSEQGGIRPVLIYERMWLNVL